MIDKNDLELLANLIKEEIAIQFKDVHLTKNLLNTLSITEGINGFEVHIPAKIYSFYDYFINGVIVYTGAGSYASELDKKGSEIELWKMDKSGCITKTLIKPHNHQDYINIAIQNAIIRFQGGKGWHLTLEKH